MGDLPANIDPTLSAMLDARLIISHRTNEAGVAILTSSIGGAVGKARGWSRAANIRRGFSVVAADFVTQDPVSHDFTNDDHLKLHCKLKGASRLFGAGQEATVEEGRLSFLVQPQGSVKRELFGSDVHSRTVTLVCSREFMLELLPDRHAMPGPLVDYLDGAASFCFRDTPMPSPMRAVSEDLFALGDEPLSDLMLEAKALELLCLSMRELSSPVRVDPVKAHVRRKVELLCELLDTAHGSAMSIAQLARTLAWNETQMMEGFRIVKGTTISAYRLRLRMEQALVRLRDTECTVNEIAYEAGYEHPSNFATAFKRTFGFTPSTARTRMN